MSDCATCRHHTLEKRDFARDILDGDLKLVEYDEVEAHVYHCTLQANREMGIVRQDLDVPEAERGEIPGAGCLLYAIGTKGSLDPELEKRLAAREARNKERE